MRLLREPLLHFLLLGAGLFWLSARLGGPAQAPDRIVVSAARIESLATGFARTWQRPPTREELGALVEDYVREAVYYREALALGLDEDDTVVRRRMRQKLEFVAEDGAGAAPPTEAELEAYRTAHAEVFRLEPSLAFRHVFLSRERRGERAEADAREILARLEAAGDGADPSALGDASLLPAEVALSSRSELAGSFGGELVERLFALEPGRWEGPLESPYGLHLVRIDERREGRLPALSEVREAAEREWQNARRVAANEAYYQRLRARYEVTIEGSGSGL